MAKVRKRDYRKEKLTIKNLFLRVVQIVKVI